MFSPRPLALSVGFIGALSVYCLARIPIRPAINGVIKSLPFILILVILQIIFASRIEGEEVILEFLGKTLTQSILTNAFMLVYRFGVLILIINALVMTISTAQTTAALFHLLKPFEKMGFPVNDLTMVVQITLRYLPLVAQIAEKITKAQASRGGDWERRGFNPIRQAKQILPMIIPIIISSLKKAEIMATAMESRGFNAAEKRSSFYSLRLDWQDVMLLFMAILFLLMMVLNNSII
jgi:energy-coupling factor transport system permease protein